MRKLIMILMFIILGFEVFSNNDLKGKVIIYRESNYYGGAISYKISANDSLIIKIRNNTFYIYECIPGNHTFEVNNIDRTKVKLDVKEGETYYLRFVLRSGFWTSIPELLLVDSISAYDKINTGTMRRLKDYDEILIRPKARIGLELNPGVGFESIPMIVLENGEDAEISFGGGFGFGFSSGYEFNRYLDLSFNINHKSSNLIPYVNNAEITFSRTNIRLTPSLIIPIDGGYSMRLKFGAGLDYYLNNNLDFQTEEMQQGFIDKWHYENSFGTHAMLTYELTPTEKWTVSYGLCFYNIEYKYTRSDKYTYPINNKLINADGSGFSLLIGMYYNF